MSLDLSNSSSFIKSVSELVKTEINIDINNAPTRKSSKNESENESDNESETNEPIEKENVIIINRKKYENKIKFFIHRKGYKPRICEEKKDTKIREIIEKYIINIGEKEDIKNNFYFDDNPIDNLNCTIGELGIEHLGIIVCKY